MGIPLAELVEVLYLHDYVSRILSSYTSLHHVQDIDVVVVSRRNAPIQGTLD